MRWYLMAMVGLVMAGSVYAGPDMPAVMLLEGSVSVAAGSPATSPGDADRVLAFSLADGQLLGAGPVSGGRYVLILSRTASFNGSSVVLELQQGLKRFALLRDGAGSAAMLRFTGKTLPDRTIIPLRAGRQTAELTAAEAGDAQAQRLSLRTDLPCTAEADVNHDGVCDEVDLNILRLYGGGISRTVGRP